MWLGTCGLGHVVWSMMWFGTCGLEHDVVGDMWSGACGLGHDVVGNMWFSTCGFGHPWCGFPHLFFGCGFGHPWCGFPHLFFGCGFPHFHELKMWFSTSVFWMWFWTSLMWFSTSVFWMWFLTLVMWFGTCGFGHVVWSMMSQTTCSRPHVVWDIMCFAHAPYIKCRCPIRRHQWRRSASGALRCWWCLARLKHYRIRWHRPQNRSKTQGFLIAGVTPDGHIRKNSKYHRKLTKNN